MSGDPFATVVDDGAGPGGRLQPGDRVSQFRIVGLLGVGGMGEVYEAEDERLGRRVALKSVLADRRLNERAKRRFLHEAQTLSRMDHPHICRVHDYLEHDGRDFIVLELISGKPLPEAVKGMRRAGRLRLAEQIADALVEAHKANIVHRDLKPDNVMVTQGGDAKVLDFGISRSEPGGASGEATGPAVTREGAVIGTPLYMSPEQAAGERSSFATDMFSFGLLLQEMETGAPPRDATQSETDLLEAARQARRQPLRGVDRQLAKLIAQLTAKRPSDRPRAEEALRRIHGLRRRPVRLAVGAAAAVIIVLGVLGGIKYTVDLDAQRTRAVQARGDAEEQIQFVLDDLYDRLSAVGRVDVLEATANRILAYYERRGVGELSQEELVRYARGLQLVSEVQFDLKDFDAAARAIDEQIRLLEEVLASDPTNGEAIKALGTGHFYLGYIGYERGDLGVMEREMLRYLELSERLAALDDANTEWLMEVAYANTNLGVLYDAQGKGAEARERFEGSYAIKRRIIDLQPDDPVVKEDLASSLAWLMRSQDRVGDLDGALATSAESLSLRERVFELDPSNAEAKHMLAVSLSHHGRLLAARQRDADAEVAFERMVSLARELLAIDPGNPIYQRELAVAHCRLGVCARNVGDFDRARASLGASREILASLAAQSPDNLDAALDLSDTVLEQARLEVEAGDPGLAASLISDHPAPPADSARARSTHSHLSLTAGRARESLGDAEGATTAYEAALAMLEGVDEDSAHVDALRAELLLRLGRVDEAAPIRERLRSTGRPWPALDQLAAQLD